MHPPYIKPVELDGSNGPDARFPYKTGDRISCLYNGGFDPVHTVYFVTFTVIANDRDTGTLVVWHSDAERLETLDPSWTDFVTAYDPALPSAKVPADSLDWNTLDPANTGGPRINI